MVRTNSEYGSGCFGAERLQRELAYAIGRTDRTELRAWGVFTAKAFSDAAARRVTAVVSLASKIARAAWAEAKSACAAGREGRTATYIERLGDRAVAAGIDLLSTAKRTYQQVADLAKANPTAAAAQVLAGVLGASLGAGGLDGDGGAPDLDLLAGIDAHRSILTHSIVLGVTLETALRSLIDLTSRIHRNLPPDHDPFWDNLVERQGAILEAFGRGASAGIAYHLFFDSTFQPGAYHDLPFAAPMAVHQAILGVNAVSEGVDSVKRPSLETYPRSVSKATGLAGNVAGTPHKLVRHAAGTIASFTVGFKEEWKKRQQDRARKGK